MAQVQFDLEEERNKVPFHKQTWTGEDDLRDIVRAVKVEPVEIQYAVESKPDKVVLQESTSVKEDDCESEGSACLLKDDVQEEDKENTDADKEDTAVIEKALNSSNDGNHKVVNIDRSRVKNVNECNQQ